MRRGHARRCNLGLWLPLLFLTLATLSVVLIPILVPMDPDAQSLANRLESPSLANPFGTDHLGRDIFSRVVHGGRFSLAIAAIATITTFAIGVFLGLLSAMKGGWVDEFLTRTNDMLLSLPEIVVALLVIAIMGPGFASMIVAVTIMGWTPTARLVRSLGFEILSKDYVEVARHLGCSKWFIIRHHVIPGLASPVIAQTALRFGLLLVGLGALSYLGVGVQPPQSDWGSMLADAQPYAARAPWGLLAPGAAIFLVTLSITLVGNAITHRTGRRDLLLIEANSPDKEASHVH